VRASRKGRSAWNPCLRNVILNGDKPLWIDLTKLREACAFCGVLMLKFSQGLFSKSVGTIYWTSCSTNMAIALHQNIDLLFFYPQKSVICWAFPISQKFLKSKIRWNSFAEQFLPFYLLYSFQERGILLRQLGMDTKSGKPEDDCRYYERRAMAITNKEANLGGRK